MIENIDTNPKYISDADRLAFEIKGIELYLGVLKKRLDVLALEPEVPPDVYDPPDEYKLSGLIVTTLGHPIKEYIKVEPVKLPEQLPEDD